ncbi:MAG: PAS domain S-box protein [Alphaproteobacteria bacterium]|nr:PAS domain S-box protein [Alphaproteobacteria bacterium]
MTSAATLAALNAGQKAIGGRLRGALLGLAAGAPATLALITVAVIQVVESRGEASGPILLLLLAFATAGVGAWIGAVGVRRAVGGDSARLSSVLRALATGERCQRFGGPYDAGEAGELTRAVDGIIDRVSELRDTLERHRLLSGLSTDVFFRLAPDATFLAVSPSVTRLLGYESQELVGRSCYDFLHPDDLAATRQKHDELLSGGASTLALKFRRKTGGYVSVEFISRLRRDEASGRAYEILAVIRDVSERAEHARELERTRRDAAATGRSRSSFLSNMSHDLRTPLNIIIGLSQIIRDQMFGPVGQRYIDYARDIESSGHDLLDLINDLLDLSKVEAGRWQVEERAVSITRNIDAVFTMVSARGRLAQVALESRLGPELPLVLADERAVRQTLLNVISSALKRVTPSSVITIDGKLVDRQVVVVVEGQSRAVESRDGYVKDPLEGSVGLALASDLMRLHGGRLDLQTTAEQRLVVTLTFPPERSLTGPATPLRLVAEAS